MKRKIVTVLALCAIAGLGFAGWLFWPQANNRQLLLTAKGDVGRGAYMARASGCFACHTNAKAKGAVLAGGGPLETPFGTFYAPNITSHKTDGIGAWSLTDFANALRRGISPSGNHYYPVFLYPNYAKLSDQDVADLWAAFKTVPPVAGKPPDHDLKFPFQYRFLLGAWKKLFFDSSSYKPNPDKSKNWNRGAFLVNGPAHCSTCHTPKNLFGGMDYDHGLAGDASGPGGEKVPALTAAALRKKGWTAKDIVFALKTGSKPNGDVFSGTMGEVVLESTRFLNDADLSAIAEYLLSQTKTK